MKDSELQFDRTCHMLYSKPCKKEILAKIALHYPEAEREAVWEKVQRQYVEFLSDWRTDLGGKKNFHNGAGGTYDCIAILSYYAACKAVTSFREIEEMEENLVLPSFRKLKFVDCNKPFFRKLMYKAFTRAKSLCDQWHDYEMDVAPFDPDKPIYYEFTACPAAEFANCADLDSAPPIGTMAAKRTQSRSSPPMAGCPHMRKNFVYFSKNIPRGSFTIKKCFDRIKAQFIHAQSSNAKTVSRYLGEEVA